MIFLEPSNTIWSKGRAKIFDSRMRIYVFFYSTSSLTCADIWTELEWVKPKGEASIDSFICSYPFIAKFHRDTVKLMRGCKQRRQSCYSVLQIFPRSCNFSLQNKRLLLPPKVVAKNLIFCSECRLIPHSPSPWITFCKDNSSLLSCLLDLM